MPPTLSFWALCCPTFYFTLPARQESQSNTVLKHTCSGLGFVFAMFAGQRFSKWLCVLWSKVLRGDGLRRCPHAVRPSVQPLTQCNLLSTTGEVLVTNKKSTCAYAYMFIQIQVYEILRQRIYFFFLFSQVWKTVVSVALSWNFKSYISTILYSSGSPLCDLTLYFSGQLS